MLPQFEWYHSGRFFRVEKKLLGIVLNNKEKLRRTWVTSYVGFKINYYLLTSRSPDLKFQIVW